MLCKLVNLLDNNFFIGRYFCEGEPNLLLAFYNQAGGCHVDKFEGIPTL